jgi:DNA-binding NarL/FixJ family response regulator
MARPIRVLLVEDNEVFREALELLFDLRSDIDVVGAVGDGEAALPACRRLEPDVVLMDYRLPVLDGVQATAEIHRACPGVAVLCLTASVSERELAALAEAGAVECVGKDAELDRIIDAIRRAAGRSGDGSDRAWS